MESEPNDLKSKLIQQVITEVSACVRQVSGDSVVGARELIGTAPRIFVAGAGRSGLCMRSFAMRLMHLGKTTYIVGQTTTPSITNEDLLILGSGSGRTASLIAMAELARRKGAKVLLFTAALSSPLADLANHRVIIPAPAYRNVDEKIKSLSIQPMGTLFEQALLITCDALILELMQTLGVDVAQMSKRHANLE